MAQLDKEYDYFLSHEKELKEKYLGKVVVIRDNTILGYYDSENEAIADTEKKFPLGTFLVKKIEEARDGKIMRFHSRVYHVQ